MKIETPTDEKLVRYLLDDLPDAERQEIEERFFQDDSLFEAMVALEDDLHYDYQQNRLNQKERAAFERKFLVTPKDHEKAAFATAFLEATAEIAVEKAATSKKVVAAPSWWQSIVAFFDFSPMQFGLAAATLLLLFGAGFLIFQNWQLRREMANLENNRAAEINKQEQLIAEKQRQQAELEQQLSAEKQQREQNEERIAEIEAERQRLEQEIAEARRRIKEIPQNPVSPPQPQQQRTVIAFSLAPGLSVRSGGSVGNRIKLSPSIKTLRLSLLLKNAGEFQSYRATLNNVDEGEVWTGSTSKVRGKGAKKSVSVSIPAGILKRGDYELMLSGVTANGEAEEIPSYYFSVLK